MLRTTLALTLLLGSVATFAQAAEKAKPLIIGTGAVTGIYFPASGAVQRLVNDGESGVKLAVQSTAGSIANLKAVADGTLDLAMSQADWAHYASKGGQEQFTTGNENLRALMGFHTEVLTIIARKDAKIASLDDLKGKKINLGPTASGTRAIMNLLFKAMKWDVADMGSLMDMEPGEQAAAMCEGKVDAIVFLVPHPNGSVQDALSKCASNLVSVSGAGVESVLAATPFYSKYNVPADMYREITAEVPTFGVQALLVTTKNLPEATAYSIVNETLKNMAALNAIHPALSRLTTASMVSDTKALPVHTGAVKYFKEAGLVK
jgi:uncharacterized protein